MNTQERINRASFLMKIYTFNGMSKQDKQNAKLAQAHRIYLIEGIHARINWK